MFAFVFAAWQFSFGLRLHTQLHLQADFEGYREMSPRRLKSLPKQKHNACRRGGEIPGAQTQFLLGTDIGVFRGAMNSQEKCGTGAVPRSEAHIYLETNNTKRGQNMKLKTRDRFLKSLFGFLFFSFSWE